MPKTGPEPAGTRSCWLMVELVRGHVSDHGGEGKTAIRRDIAKPFYAPKKDRETYPLIIGI